MHVLRSLRYVISLGYLVTLVVTVPLGFVNLDDNMIVVRLVCDDTLVLLHVGNDPI